MFPSIIHQVHINYVTKHHYITIIPLVKEKYNVEFNQESKDSHRQDIILSKIEFVLKNIHKSFANL
jgi:hypothetical protein